MRTQLSMLSFLGLLVLALSRSASAAPKWNLTASITSPFLADKNVDVDPYDIPANCTAPGVCVPYPVSLANNTMWYWCNWRAQQRTDYYIRATGNISAQIMRVHALDTCALPNLAGIGSCEIIFGSLCDTKRNCSLRVLGLAFEDEVCLVIANNGKTKLDFTVQIFQYTDWPRYYGAIFSIILTIILLSGVLFYIGYTCYHEISSTPDRIIELRSFEAQLERSNTIDPKTEAEHNDPQDPGTFQGRVKVALTRVKGLMSRNKGASQA